MMNPSLNCPYCKEVGYVGYLETPECQETTYEVVSCCKCGLPFVASAELKIIRNSMKIEGFGPQIKFEYEADIPLAPQPGQLHCDNCTQEFDAETMYIDHETGAKFCMPCYNTLSAAHDKRQEEDDCTTCNPRRMMEICGELPSELKPTDDIQRYTPRGTHPDPDTFLCNSCGTLNGTRELHIQPNGEKWCVSCIGRDMEDKHVEEPKKKDITFKNIAGTNVWYSIQGETVHLKYNNTKCGAWDRTTFDYMAELPVNKQDAELKELVKDLSCKTNRKTALRQFLYALERGDVEFEVV